MGGKAAWTAWESFSRIQVPPPDTRVRLPAFCCLRNRSGCAKVPVLTALLGLPLVAGILWIFQNVDNAWLWAWLVFTAFQLLMTYLAPSLILPLFNKFEPMEDGELKSAILAYARGIKFPLENVYQMDGSRRSTKSNAFFMIS